MSTSLFMIWSYSFKSDVICYTQSKQEVFLTVLLNNIVCKQLNPVFFFIVAQLQKIKLKKNL